MSAPLEVKIYQAREEIYALRAEMSALYDACPDAMVYGSTEWLFAWLETLGSQNDLHFITVRAGEELVAYWGFFECPAIGKRGLWPWGIHSGDEFSPIVHPAFPQAQELLFKAVFSRLKDFAFVWIPLCRPRLLEDLHAHQAREKKIGIFEKLWSDDPVIVLEADSFDAYLEKTFSSKTRQTFRRYERKLATDGELHWARYESAQDMPTIYEKMESIERTSWKGNQAVGLFVRPEVREFYKEVLPALAARGWVTISVLQLNGRSLAYEFAFLRGKIYGMHNIAFRPEAGIYSPGKLLMLKNIEYAFSRNCQTYDFLQGDEPYKKEFANASLPLIDVTLYPKNPLGYLNHWAVRLAGFSKKRPR